MATYRTAGGVRLANRTAGGLRIVSTNRIPLTGQGVFDPDVFDHGVFDVDIVAPIGVLGPGVGGVRIAGGPRFVAD